MEEKTKDMKYWLERKKNAQIARSVAAEAVNQADEELEKFYMQEFEGYVGKCFKVPDSSGDDNWFDYYKVRKIVSVYPNEGANRNAYVNVLRFCVRSGYATICDDSAYLSTIDDYPISEKEFIKEYMKVLAILQP